MATLRILNGEIELFETSLDPDATRYLGINAGSQVGAIFTVGELEALLRHIGSAPAWDWIRLCDERDPARWTRARGRADVGLVVEVNGRGVIKDGAERFPRVDLSTSTSTCIAYRNEIHFVAEAAERLVRWRG